MPIYKFSPNLASAEERELTFVARDAVLEDLLDRARKIESGAQHCILIGPRGIGKTHLLLLLRDRIEGDKSLASQWEVVRFSEEEYGVTNLADFLLRIIELMPGDKPANIRRDADLALAHIMDFSATSGKRLLLLMDNIHLYFNYFPDADVGRLRDILMSKSVFLIVGAAPSYFKQMTGYEESFYNFFEPIHLNELTSDEVEKMLQYRAEFEENQDLLAKFNECQQEIRTITHLTGGNPRLILMLYQVMCESDVMAAAEAFKQLLDELTPYFQSRMEGLPPQGRKVMDTLASMESPSTPTELAEATGMQVNAVTSQLKRLKDGGYVQQVKRRRSKATRYEVTERLFRMWREMRTETGRTRLNFLIRFLDLWYTPTQLLDETGKLLTQLAEAEGQEKPRLLSHLQYLKEASSGMLQPLMKTIYSYAEDDKPEMAVAGIPLLKKLMGYDEDVKAEPDNVAAWIGRGAAMIILGRHQEAFENFDKATRVQPDDTEAWGLRGIALLLLDKRQEALKSFSKATQIQPDDAEAWNNRGSILHILGRYEEALESYDKAIQIQPDNAITWYSRGSILHILGRYEEALESYDKAIQIQPDDATTWYSRGLALSSLEKYEEALENYDRAIQIQPGEEVQIQPGEEVQIQPGEEVQIQPGMAIQIQPGMAIQIQPDYARAWHERGMALRHLERYEEAVESYDRAIQIQPDYARAWHNRGVALRYLERYEEMLESCDKAIQIQPDYARAWANRGAALDNLARYEEALESYDKAIQIQPDYARAWINRGGVLVHLESYEDALESYDKAIQIQPDYATAWHNRGGVLVHLESYEEALESYDRAIQIQPDYATAWHNRGVALSSLGKYEEALESRDMAIQIQPDHAYAWAGRGDALYNLERYEEALESCDRAIQIQPDRAYAWNNRGVALVHLGRHDEALESLKKAVELAKAQNLKKVSEFAGLLAAETELLDSLGSLVVDNLGSARRSLKNALDNGKQADSRDFQLVLFHYLKESLKSGKNEFVQEAIEMIVSELGAEYGELFSPFSLALDYMQTEDESILERLQQEVRELVLEIVEYAKN